MGKDRKRRVRGFHGFKKNMSLTTQRGDRAWRDVSKIIGINAPNVVSEVSMMGRTYKSVYCWIIFRLVDR